MKKEKQSHTTCSKITITKKKYHTILDFTDGNVKMGMDHLMRLLLNGEKNILCKNLNIADKGVLGIISESVNRCYKEKYPDSNLKPVLELHDPCGDDVYYLAKLHRKLIV